MSSCLNRRFGTCAFIAVGALVSGVNVQADSISVVNPSFEAQGNFGGNGYLAPVEAGNPAAITGWANSATNTGINTAGQPFAVGTNIPDFNHVAFIQGSGDLTQTLSGLDTSKQYWVQAFYNARQGNGNPSLQVQYGSQVLTSVTGIAVNNPNYTFVNLPFIPSASSATLSLSNPSGTGDNTLLLDGISVIQRNANQVVIANPSFEGSQADGVGYSNTVAGWTKNSTNGIGVTPVIGGGNAFGAPTPPDGGEVLLIQDVGSVSQVLPALVAGQQYVLSLYAAQRTDQTPTLSVSVGGHNLLTNDSTLTNAFQLFTLPFTADGSDASGPTLTLTNSNIGGGDNTIFFDNISLAAVPEPSSLIALALGTGVAFVRRRRA